MIYTGTVETPLGEMLAAALVDSDEHERNAALCGLWFIGQKHFPRNTDGWVKKSNLEIFKTLNKWLKNYFAKKRELPDLPIAPNGTEFQKAIWKQLVTIPYGKTTTYGRLAEKAARSGNVRAGSSARAAGGAVGRNPISIIIPCHRVLGAGGKITGYAGGTDRKQALLELEGFYTLYP